MKTTIVAMSLVSTLFCACVFAQDENVIARKITISLQTGGPASPAEPDGQNTRAAPLFETADEILPVEATVVAVETSTTRKERRRRIEYSEDYIAIVGIAADATERTRDVILDPRLIRAEPFYGDSNRPSNRLYRPSVTFSVALTDASVVSIRILKPRWNGSEWLFDVLADAPIK